MYFETDIIKNKNTVNKIIKYCGGNTEKLKDWLKEIENKSISSLEELKEYPLKRNYKFVFSKEEAPNLDKLIKMKLRDNYLEKCEICSLENLLSMLNDEILDLNKEDISYEDNIEWIGNCKEELIKLKVGSICIDW
ncbi:TPA: hypothetical protein KR288_002750 [Clostridioides difficile]|uniref:Uncharacterized protein n=1 Tax=Clostridioides difficile TaxID=1496 RepID=A0AAN5VJY7_CLODI|nr:hypothetical protein [Clostridioides difficile]EGT3829101.1 hypothetical protein [Clostridioides difficile]EGT5564459.1 hypothetical protein [Clostridioides difficile]EIS9475123.1 hypothetical protein [Clostridioides difficile]EIS9655025.1 hypothetical protein [Clostridioides difficile]EJX2691279.1 hypothetical protein [Clostridioides difficile]